MRPRAEDIGGGQYPSQATGSNSARAAPRTVIRPNTGTVTSSAVRTVTVRLHSEASTLQSQKTSRAPLAVAALAATTGGEPQPVAGRVAAAAARAAASA